MAHVTVHRALSNIQACVCSQETAEEDEADGKVLQRELKKQRSISECYFVVKGAALILPHDECRHVRRKSTNNGACVIQNHLKSMCYLLREDDTLRMAVKLETAHLGRIRYLVVISHIGSQSTEECCLLGVDCNNDTSIGLVLPIWADTRITLDGDGGFSVSSSTRHHIFKPVSVQAMWSALQTLHKASAKARAYNYFMGGGTHQWIEHYEKIISSDRSCLNEWHAMDDLVSKRPPSPDAVRTTPTEREATENLIRTKLKEVMMSVDLDEVTSKYIRTSLEEQLGMNFNDYKSFIDQEMLVILGQMDAPTEIFEYLYLGSEWNASNLEELKDKGVNHILNVTREIDNFFPGMFDYLNVRVYDDETTEMLKHWDQTYKYIRKVKDRGSKVLVHCKMGISRSASVVVAYVMKAYDWNLAQALDFVKHKRSCIKPNSGFIKQLEIYQGILDASKHRHNSLWRSKSETNLKSCENVKQKKEKDNKLDLSKRFTLYLSVPGLSPRPKSWSPSDALMDSIFPSCPVQPSQIPDMLFGQTFKPLRQRSNTDPACYLNLEIGSAQAKPIQAVEPCPTSNTTVPRVSSIKDRINELVSQVTVPVDPQKTPSKFEIKPSIPSASKAGLVLNLAHQFEGASKQATPSPEDDSDALDPFNSLKDTSFIQGVEPVLSQTKPPAPKHKAVLVKPSTWPQNVTTGLDVADSCDISEKALLESGLSEESVANKPSQSVKDLYSRQSSGANSQLSDPFSWSRQSSCSSCGVSSSPPVQWYLREKDSELCTCSPDGQQNSSSGSSTEQFLNVTSVHHRVQTFADSRTMYMELPSDSPQALFMKGEFSYEKEDIPWTPGTVRRTKQQIEEKNLKRTTSYDSGFPGQSHSTPSTPPELSPDSDSGASVVRSHSLRNELRPRSMVFPSRWHPSPPLTSCTPRLQKGLQDDIFLQGVPHSVSTPSVVEAVNEVLCGTRMMLNHAMQSLPTPQDPEEQDHKPFVENTVIPADNEPSHNVARQPRDTFNPSRNTQELGPKLADSYAENIPREQVQTFKDLEQSLVNSQTDEDSSCGVVRRLTKELEAKTGTIVTTQKKERAVSVGHECKEQEALRKDSVSEKENSLALCTSIPSSPSSSKRLNPLLSDNHNAKDKFFPSHKTRTLSDVTDRESPENASVLVPSRKTSYDMDHLRKSSMTQFGDTTFSEQNRVGPAVQSGQVTNGYQGPSFSRIQTSSLISNCHDDVSSPSVVTIGSEASKPPSGTKAFGVLNVPPSQLSSQKKNKKMQQGKSHPLSKLTVKQRHANPLYNTM